LGKAGRTRWLGRRPHNRGVTMNPSIIRMAAAKAAPRGTPSGNALGQTDKGKRRGPTNPPPNSS